MLEGLFRLVTSFEKMLQHTYEHLASNFKRNQYNEPQNVVRRMLFHLLWNINALLTMVAYFCVLSLYNYVDLSDIFVDLS